MASSSVRSALQYHEAIEGITDSFDERWRALYFSLSVVFLWLGLSPNRYVFEVNNITVCSLFPFCYSDKLTTFDSLKLTSTRDVGPNHGISKSIRDFKVWVLSALEFHLIKLTSHLHSYGFLWTVNTRLEDLEIIFVQPWQMLPACQFVLTP